ncbi:DUF488 domain-containing protein [Modestobacter roseus]|uniref:Uncharacterized protein DUF488 n=1 Tax=Modestobacter roseus TaxID=1181884 RepID=A0A562IVA5_9ACTN|nr:DUF488 domain-containing protein [Modestobacter roseus]MQA33472.1 DUF488 family protein [Modestobacter roseus]TWH74937.1 uncharacterized protein DUF488 [Modestobacter roseus]
MPLLTVGHGPDDRTRLGERLRTSRITELVDVRRFPGSRVNPEVRREALEAWLPERGVAYRWEEQLGGRRRGARGRRRGALPGPVLPGRS